MEIKITKLTDADLMRKACEFTTGKESHVSLDAMYDAEHSPIRTQLFWIEMYDIPTFVSNHFVRHKVGVEHYVRSNRDDRGGDAEADRNTPVNHAMLINSQALLNMAHKRLCGKAHPETRRVMSEIVRQIAAVDYALVPNLIPTCVYRGGVCYELKSCGFRTQYKQLERLLEDQRNSDKLL